RAAGESLNMRGAYLEVLGDLLGSVAVVVAAVVVMTTGWVRADAVASLVIGLLIVPRAVMLLRDVADALMEATPRDVDLARVREHIRSVPGVVDVHDLHAWTITSGVPVLSAHVVLAADRLDHELECTTLDALAACLRGHFDVDHCTFQLEPVGHEHHEGSVHRGVHRARVVTRSARMPRRRTLPGAMPCAAVLHGIPPGGNVALDRYPPAVSRANRRARERSD